MNQNTKKHLVIGAIIVGIIAVFIVGLQGRSPNLGTSQEYSDPNGPAVMANASELFTQMDTFSGYDSLRADLTTFANNNISAYTKSKVNGVVFNVDKTSKKESTIELRGKYEASKNPITVVIQLMSNDKIHVKIEDKKTQVVMEEGLSSNSSENEFIGSLPIERRDYFITYSTTDDLFVVEMKNDNDESRIAAGIDLADSLGREVTRFTDYIILPPAKEFQTP